MHYEASVKTVAIFFHVFREKHYFSIAFCHPNIIDTSTVRETERQLRSA
jgi:hypothetical protein